MKRLLIVLSHPDDESFAVGGTIAKYVEEGWQVDLVSATRGEAGNSDLSPEDLGVVRQKELEKAGTVLGVHSVTFLSYSDGQLASLIPGDIEDVIFQKIVELTPDVVITMDTSGITNHPDHIRVSYATTYAFQKYAKWIEETLAEEENLEEALPKLYYVCMPESVVLYLQKQKKLESESFGRPWRGVEDKFITATVDISEYAEVKKEALSCHKTQEADMAKYLSWSPIFQNEYFILRMQGTTEAFMGKNDIVSHEL